MNEQQIEMMSKIKAILNEAGYHLKDFTIHDVSVAGYKEYITSIQLRADEFKKEEVKK
jgi:hypothetical protein